MGSIYVHIPFCKKRCTYCNFYSTVNLSNIDAYVEAVCLEAVERKNYLRCADVTTLYFGGGTPSLLRAEHINKIYATLEANYNLKKLEEFTIECNPDDINPAFIAALKTTKVNRISIGIQSFDDAVLTFINRRHNASQAINAIKALQTAGYSNISIDLIYGIPNQSMESWRESVKTALELDVQHISAYSLQFEEGTAMYKHIKESPDEEVSLSMYEHLCTALEKAGFEHYEISNFARPGYRSRHNSAYWNATEYLGLGAGAHSYNGTTRNWNTEMHTVGGKITWSADGETLTEQDKYNDLIVTALRTKDGIAAANINPKYLDSFNHATEKMEAAGLIKREQGRVMLTKKGIFVSNTVMREYIEV